jgi:phosphomannomutase
VNKFIFDVDGTLTPSRQQIDPNFAIFFGDFCAVNDVYLVTGSDKPKTVEQIGEDIYSLAKRVYNCSGCDVWEGETNIRSSNWKLKISEKTWLLDKLEESQFPLRTGLHIEERQGMVNFSVVGRNATMGERKLYVKYDTEFNERNTIADLFNKEFPNLVARPGGETGIDISPKGNDKSQILQDFNHEDKIYFFGDRMDPAGNDYPLKKALYDGYYNYEAYSVQDWQDTWERLNEINVDRT